MGSGRRGLWSITEHHIIFPFWCVMYEVYIFIGIVRGIGVSIQGWWYVDDQVFVLHRLCRFPWNVKWESAFMMQS